MEDLREVLRDLYELLPERRFATRLPNGEVIAPEPGEIDPEFTLVLKRPAALRRMLLPPSELAMGEAYIFDDFDIEGDSVAAFGFLDGITLRRPSLTALGRLAWHLWQLERRAGNNVAPREDETGHFAPYTAQGKLHNRDRDRQAAQFHYDMSNDFYRLWLDKRMVYSCAFFSHEGETLDQAQENKLELICSQLNLQQEERLLDIGCGWGGLIIYAASRYGVRAEGISLSEAQTKEARARIQALGLGDRCEVKICHYEAYHRDAPMGKVVSVGMFEHVGKEKLGSFLAKVHNLLPPGGLFLLQGGATRADRRHAGRRWMDRLGLGRTAFMQKYSFPNSDVLELAAVLETSERAGFEILDVASLRRHYVLTIRHWLSNLERNQAAAIAEVGQVAYRCWRLILSGYIYLLDKGYLSEYQTLLAKRPL